MNNPFPIRPSRNDAQQLAGSGAFPVPKAVIVVATGIGYHIFSVTLQTRQ